MSAAQIRCVKRTNALRHGRVLIGLQPREAYGVRRLAGAFREKQMSLTPKAPASRRTPYKGPSVLAVRSNALALGVACLVLFAAMPSLAQSINLLQRYPTELVEGDAAPERARPWTFS